MKFLFPKIHLTRKYAPIIQGLLIIIFTLHHISEKTSCFFPDFMNHIGLPISSIFFFLSGCCLLIHLEKDEPYTPTIRGVVKFAIKYLLFILLYQILLLLIRGAIDIKSLYSDILSGGSNVIFPFSWYIFTLLFLYISYFAIMKFIPNRKKISIPFFFLVCFIYLFLGETFDFCFFWYIKISVYSFCAGILWKNSQIVFPKILPFICSLVSLAVLFLLLFREGGIGILLPIFLIVLVMFILEKILPESDADPLPVSFAYEIFLIQGIVVSLLAEMEGLCPNDYIFLAASIIAISAISFISLSLKSHLRRKHTL